MRHIGAALARLPEGGRLVAITGRNVGPDQPAWRDSFVRLQEKGRVVFTATIAGQAYARHGTTIETRLTVIDRVPADDPRAFPPSPGMAADVAELLGHVSRHVPPRTPVTGASPLPAPTVVVSRAPIVARPKAPQLNLVKRPAPMPDVVELAYETREWTSGASRLTANLYEGYAPQAIHFPGARRTRPSLSSRPLWPRSRRRAPPIARIYRRACHDRLDPAIRPCVVLMNPPFRVVPGGIDAAEQTAEETGARVGNFVENEPCPGQLGEDRQQPRAGGWFQHDVGGSERGRLGRDEAERDRRRELLQLFGFLGSARLRRLHGGNAKRGCRAPNSCASSVAA